MLSLPFVTYRYRLATLIGLNLSEVLQILKCKVWPEKIDSVFAEWKHLRKQKTSVPIVCHVDI